MVCKSFMAFNMAFWDSNRMYYLILGKSAKTLPKFYFFLEDFWDEKTITMTAAGGVALLALLGVPACLLYKHCGMPKTAPLEEDPLGDDVDWSDEDTVEEIVSMSSVSLHNLTTSDALPGIVEGLDGGVPDSSSQLIFRTNPSSQLSIFYNPSQFLANPKIPANFGEKIPVPSYFLGPIPPPS